MQKDILETFINPQKKDDYLISMDIPEFTCICPLTSQPDFAAAQTDVWARSGHSRGTTTAWTLAGAEFVHDKSEKWCTGCTEAQRELFSSGALRADGLAVSVPLAGTHRSWMFGAILYA